MGLNSTWDDSARANDNVPPLNKPFPYGTLPIRGVNIGGWLSLEPWITPSLFRGYSDDVIDEYTLSQQLGDSAAETIEKHYATFITEQDFADIRDAGLDHVRIPFSYWAVSPIDGEPYVPKISWRYLLRAIEYCRKYGLRVKLDPHGLPGSQNGFNHSGKQGSINWLNGDDGDANAQRSLDFHDKVSKFFSQDRYKNVVAIYGLANEPYMLSLDIQKVLNWTSTATELVQKNGISAWVAFHDGFLNLSKWKSMLKSGPSELLLDTHQYTIFNTAQIVLNHTAKVNLVCNDWHAMIGEINTTSAGYVFKILLPLPVLILNIGGAQQSAVNGLRPTLIAQKTSTTLAAELDGKAPMSPTTTHSTALRLTLHPPAAAAPQTQTHLTTRTTTRPFCRPMRRPR
jgi:glucan 1,3-beta-glucosidase